MARILKSIGILFAILILALVFSIIYPFYSINEGLGTSLLPGDISSIQTALTTYSTAANSNCQTAVNTINPLLNSDPKLSMNVTMPNDAPVVQPCTTVDSIHNQGPSNTTIMNAINTCYGANYAAVLNLLNTINSPPANQALKNDPTGFGQLIKSNTDKPSVSGSQSTYNQIYQYISAAQM